LVLVVSLFLDAFFSLKNLVVVLCCCSPPANPSMKSRFLTVNYVCIYCNTHKLIQL
ncbi:unnamed protein product, partial [Brassica oleracea var. botrytis]